MLAVASLLDSVADEQTKDLWRRLEEKCGLTGIWATPFPHFSWMSCQGLDWSKVSKKLEKDGLCLFAVQDGKRPAGEAPRMDA